MSKSHQDLCATLSVTMAGVALFAYHDGYPTCSVFALLIAFGFAALLIGGAE
jgi:hypothetical protein